MAELHFAKIPPIRFISPGQLLAAKGHFSRNAANRIFLISEAVGGEIILSSECHQ